MSQLSHFDETGAARMVDVASKDVTFREARAVAYVSMRPETLQIVLRREAVKGDVLEVSRLAGILAAKRTADLIPLCHPLPLDSIEIHFEPADDRTLLIEAKVATHARTGVEMEALTAASAAALTVYDMCKSADREMVIGPIGVVEKSGGRSGHFVRQLKHDSQES